MNHFPSYLCTMNCWFGILWLFKSYSLRWTPSPPSLHMTWASLARGWSWPGHFVVTSLGWPRELLTSPLDCRGATTRCQWVAMWQYWQYWQSMARPDQVMRGSPGAGTSTGHGQPRPLASVLSSQCPGPGLNTSLSPGPGSLSMWPGVRAAVTISCSCLQVSSCHPAHHAGSSDSVFCFPHAELCSPGWPASVNSLGGWVAEWLYNWNILSRNRIPRKETIFLVLWKAKMTHEFHLIYRTVANWDSMQTFLINWGSYLTSSQVYEYFVIDSIFPFSLSVQLGPTLCKLKYSVKLHHPTLTQLKSC